MIRRTSGFAETVSYLTLMTRMITDLYKVEEEDALSFLPSLKWPFLSKGKVLTVCPKNELVFHADKPRTALMSFLEFNQASKKSKVRRTHASKRDRAACSVLFVLSL